MKENLEEEVTEKMPEIVTEGVMDSSGEEETPTIGVGTWLVVGLSLGVLLVLGIAIKRILKWFKKGKNTMS